MQCSPWIKICGITSVADAELAVSLGADAIGLNFYPQSPRHISMETARRILAQLPPSVEPIALFADEPWPSVLAILQQLGGIRTVQGHGSNRDMPAAFTYQLIAAFPAGSQEDLYEMTHHLDRCRQGNRLPAALLVDAHVPGLHGGTGRVLPWGLLADFRPGVPLILAGGLTPENVAEAIRTVRPSAVDVASGVESAPGKKDADKLRRFIDNARNALRSL